MKKEARAELCQAQQGWASLKGPVSTLEHIESEVHYLFHCSAYRNERDEWLHKLKLPVNFDHLALEFNLKIGLNDTWNTKATAQFITTAYNIRSKIF